MIFDGIARLSGGESGSPVPAAITSWESFHHITAPASHCTGH
jgi:hypothetical protein